MDNKLAALIYEYAVLMGVPGIFPFYIAPIFGCVLLRSQINACWRLRIKQRERTYRKNTKDRLQKPSIIENKNVIIREILRGLLS
jgi:hypothetical protein